jgi:hypothetical protein
MRSLVLNENCHKINGLGKKFRYTGSSMRSTFKPGQVLYVRPTTEGVQPGDVVVYRRGKVHIVHRVKKVIGPNVITRGDNNPREDAELVQPGQIVGVVEKVDDWGNFRPVAGGRVGLWLARLRWGATTLINQLRPVIGAPYRWLKARRWINLVWHPEVVSIQLQSSEGIMVKYVVRGKTVATWYHKESRFEYKRPYDLVIFPPKKIK